MNDPVTEFEIRALSDAIRRDYEQWIAEMVEHCHCQPESLRPCDGVLAGGVCDGVKEEPKECSCWKEPGDPDCEEHCP